MTFDSFLAELQDWDMVVPLFWSVVSGVLIGWEREYNRKPAGLRTHTLVCFASTLMTLVGLRMNEWVASFPEGTQIVSDMSRMPHAILTGIGFLGAGVIFRTGVSVNGLTTAASLWLMAAIGIIYGTGLIELGVKGTLMALIVLIVLRGFQRFFPPPPFARLELTADAGFDRARLQQHLAQSGFDAGPMAQHEDLKNATRRYILHLSHRGPGPDAEPLLQRLRQDPSVRKIDLTPDAISLGDSS